MLAKEQESCNFVKYNLVDFNGKTKVPATAYFTSEVTVLCSLGHIIIPQHRDSVIAPVGPQALGSNPGTYTCLE